uniref:Uncharacterized protein n=1 Tax=viral metagenome TaxID=1070528 RepID=A0A6M3JID2_9ZZZZ
MDLMELRVWLQEHITDEERNLEMIKESNRKMPIPDIVARRVVETQIMDYRNILRRINV